MEASTPHSHQFSDFKASWSPVSKAQASILSSRTAPHLRAIIQLDEFQRFLSDKGISFNDIKFEFSERSVSVIVKESEVYDLESIVSSKNLDNVIKIAKMVLSHSFDLSPPRSTRREKSSESSHHRCAKKIKQLNEKLLAAKEINLELQLKNQSLSEQLATATLKANKSQEELTRLTSELESVQKELAESKVEVVRLKATLDAQTAELSLLREENGKLRSSLRESEIVREELRVSLARNEEQLADAKSSLAEKNRANIDLVTRIERLTSERISLEVELGVLKKIAPEQTKKISELETTLEQLRITISLLEETNKRQHDEIQSLTASNNELRVANSALRTAQEEQQTLLSSLTITKELHLAEIKEIKGQLDSSNEEVSTLLAQQQAKKALEDQIRGLTAELTSTRSDNTSITARLRDLEAEKANHEEAITSITTSLQEKNAEITDLSTINTDQQARIKILEDQLTSLRSAREAIQNGLTIQTEPVEIPSTPLEELERTKAAEDTLQKALADNASVIGSLRIKLSLSGTTNVELQEKLRGAELARDQALELVYTSEATSIAQSTALQSALDLLKDENQRIKTQIAVLEKIQPELSDKLKLQLQENAQLQEQLRILQVNLEIANKNVSRLEAAAIIDKTNIAELERAKELQSEALDELQVKVNQLDTTIFRAREDISTLFFRHDINLPKNTSLESLVRSFQDLVNKKQIEMQGLESAHALESQSLLRQIEELKKLVHGLKSSQGIAFEHVRKAYDSVVGTASDRRIGKSTLDALPHLADQLGILASYYRTENERLAADLEKAEATLQRTTTLFEEERISFERDLEAARYHEGIAIDRSTRHSEQIKMLEKELEKVKREFETLKESNEQDQAYHANVIEQLTNYLGISKTSRLWNISAAIQRKFKDLQELQEKALHLDRLIVDVETKREEIDSLRSTLSARDLTIAKLQDEIDELNTTISTAGEFGRYLLKENEELTRKIESLEKALAIKQELTLVSVGAAHITTEARDELKLSLEQITAELTSVKSVKESLRTKNFDLERLNLQLTTQLEEKESSIAALSANLNDKEEELSTTVDQKTKLEEALVAAQGAALKSKSEAEQLTTLLKGAEANAAELSRKLDSVRDQHRKALKESAQLRSELEQKKEEYREAQQAVKEGTLAKAALSTMKATINEQIIQLNNTLAILEDKEKSIAKLQLELKEQQSIIESQNLTISTLRSRVRELEETLKEKDQIIATLSHNILLLKEENETLRKREEPRLTRFREREFEVLSGAGVYSSTDVSESAPSSELNRALTDIREIILTAKSTPELVFSTEDHFLNFIFSQALILGDITFNITRSSIEVNISPKIMTLLSRADTTALADLGITKESRGEGKFTYSSSTSSKIQTSNRPLNKLMNLFLIPMCGYISKNGCTALRVSKVATSLDSFTAHCTKIADAMRTRQIELNRLSDEISQKVAAPGTNIKEIQSLKNELEAIPWPIQVFGESFAIESRLFAKELIQAMTCLQGHEKHAQLAQIQGAFKTILESIDPKLKRTGLK